MEECKLWKKILHQFEEICFDFDKLWIKRKRVFDTNLIINSLMHLVGGSQKSYHQVLDCLTHVSASPAASSFCEARTKFPAFIVGEVRQAILDVFDSNVEEKKWHGFTLFAVDGSRTVLPQSFLQQGYKPLSGTECPHGLVSVLVRLEDRMVYDLSLSSHGNERKAAYEHLYHLASNDLVIYDRGYLSFGLLNSHINQKVDAIFRIQKGNGFKEIDEFWKSKSSEKIVTILPSTSTLQRFKIDFPEFVDVKSAKIRLIKYNIKGRVYVLGTTILDKAIKAREFKSLYAKRWYVEETFKGFKQTLDLENFHSKHENGIMQEIEAIGLFWNLSRMLGILADPYLKKLEGLYKLITISNQLSTMLVKAF